MYNDESNRGNQSPLVRRSIPNNKTRSSYQQNPSYPSSTYGGGYNNQQHNGGMRRRPDNNGGTLTANNRGRHFNPLDRVVKQNDIIIRLLTEIRDRLPAPPRSEQNTPAAEHSVNASSAHDESVFEVSDDQDTAQEEAEEVNFEAQEQQEEDNFNI